ncbi:hypothetical protein IMZ48_22965 [Candidatus Bathyarchaeota archaeon]|nr:hypothetical protein [Candidatus Bathyarchaeota archaeon]
MPFTPPPDERTREAFPEVESLEEFARGGFKVVYRTIVAETREVFKLVCLPPPGRTEEERAYRNECLGRIRREIELLGRCSRPELVKLGAIAPRLVTIGDIDYVGYTEEYVMGENLGVILRQRGPLPEELEARSLLRALLLAIEELWTNFRVVHRDIKPENVIKTGNPVRPFVLLDLGIAYCVSETGLTADSAQIPMTPRYMAPEMARPDFRRNLDFRADIYTSALTVFEYAAQIHPLARTRDDLIQTISRAVTQAPRNLKSERPDFGDIFCQLVAQMLKKKPMLRPSNLRTLIEEMEERR